MKRNLILITSDQLSLGISSLQNFDLNRDLVLMCELKDEATYVPHHRKKLVFIFSSMRHFAKELKDKGFEIRYTKLDDPKNAGSFLGELRRSIKDCNPEKIIVTEPGEFRLITELNNWEKKLNKRILLL